MSRHFVDFIPIMGGEIVVTGAELKHMNVLRLSKGAMVTLIDGRGNCCQALIKKIDFHKAVLKADPPGKDRTESFVKIHLIFAWTKSVKPELVVQKTTELGVFRLIPYSASRSIAKPGGQKTERLQKVAIEAAKQCGRSLIPQVISCNDLQQALALIPDGAPIFFLDETEKSKLFSHALLEVEKADEVVLVIGPEGGMEDHEREILASRAVSVSLGPRILRAETASIAALTTVQTVLGDMGRPRAEHGISKKE